jgi:hypothetical protein
MLALYLKLKLFQTKHLKKINKGYLKRFVLPRRKEKPVIKAL